MLNDKELRTEHFISWHTSRSDSMRIIRRWHMEVLPITGYVGMKAVEMGFVVI